MFFLLANSIPLNVFCFCFLPTTIICKIIALYLRTVDRNLYSSNFNDCLHAITQQNQCAVRHPNFGQVASFQLVDSQRSIWSRTGLFCSGWSYITPITLLWPKLSAPCGSSGTRKKRKERSSLPTQKMKTAMTLTTNHHRLTHLSRKPKRRVLCHSNRANRKSSGEKLFQFTMQTNICCSILSMFWTYQWVLLEVCHRNTKNTRVIVLKHMLFCR